MLVLERRLTPSSGHLGAQGGVGGRARGQPAPRWSETALPPPRVRASDDSSTAETESTPEREGAP